MVNSSERVLNSQEKSALKRAIYAAAIKQLGYQFQQPASLQMHLDGSADRLAGTDVDMISSATQAICSVMSSEYESFSVDSAPREPGQKLGRRLDRSRFNNPLLPANDETSDKEPVRTK